MGTAKAKSNVNASSIQIALYIAAQQIKRDA
jgi:hypothetical protein